jgi:hypothetical protein
MRGGVSINDLMYNYSFDDREAMYKVIESNIDLTRESGMPLI